MSGRNRLPQASRYWIVAKDFHGTPLSPAVVCNRFSATERLCKVGGDLGDSVFVGVPARPTSLLFALLRSLTCQ